MFFWVFAAATVLSHSLGGLGLAAVVVVVLALSLFVPLKVVRGNTARKVGDAPGLLLRRLIFSLPRLRRPLWVFSPRSAAGTCGFTSPESQARAISLPGTAVHPATFGQFLRNLLPGLTLGKLAVFYILVIIVVMTLVAFGGLLSLRPQWISTPLLVLLAAWIAIPGLAIVGWLLSVSTDYHRFGFLLVIPAGLSIAFLIDRLWLARYPLFGSPAREPRRTPEPPTDRSLTPFPPTVRASHRGRIAFLGVIAVALILLAAASAGPTYVRYVQANSGTSHDQLFLDSLNAIDHSGRAGSVLTIKGNLKWTWAITHRAAYAPRPGNAFLFYPVQITDSTLAYYALTSSDAVTNGLVSASLAGTNPTYVDGIPDLAAFQGGGLSGTLRIPPQLVQVTLVGALNDTPYVVGLSGSPSFQPPTGPGEPAVITYTESGFALHQSVMITPGNPSVTVRTSIESTGPDRIASLQEVITPPALLGADTQLSVVPGSFDWEPTGLHYLGLTTVVSVTPASALAGLPYYYPPAAGAAAIVVFTPSGSGPATAINGSIVVTTPNAVSSIPGLPSVVNTTQVWHQLGIEFILIPNLQSFSLYAGSFLIDETLYLQEEFGCQVYYSNSEWIVLTVP